MASVPEALIKTLLDAFKSIAKAETIIGREFQAGELSLIPISKVTLGIGAGEGSGGVTAESQGKEVVVEAASESNQSLSSPSREATFPSMESEREVPWK